MTNTAEMFIRTRQAKTITTELVLELCGPDFDSLNFEIWIVSRASLSLELPLLSHPENLPLPGQRTVQALYAFPAFRIVLRIMYTPVVHFVCFWNLR